VPLKNFAKTGKSKPASSQFGLGPADLWPQVAFFFFFYSNLFLNTGTVPLHFLLLSTCPELLGPFQSVGTLFGVKPDISR